MPIERSHIKSSSRHYAPFLCAICTNLPDPEKAVVTGCCHCYCSICVEEWLFRSSNCPVCNQDLSFTSNSNLKKATSNYDDNATMMVGNNLFFVKKLKDAQPLAYRLLRRIKVSCPLREKHGCLWVGDYGDLQCHLLSDTAHLNNNQANSDNDVVMSSASGGGGSVRHEARQGGGDNEDSDGYHDDHSECSEDSNVIEMFPQANINTNHDVKNGTGPIGKTKTNTTSSPTKRISLADSFKEEANAKFSARNYVEAAALYKKAISILKNETNIAKSCSNLNSYQTEEERKMAATLHANIAATAIMTREYVKCVDHCNIAIELDKSYTKAYLRKSKALVALGKFHSSFTVLKSLIDDGKNDGNNNIIASNEMRQTVEVQCREVKQLNNLYSHGEEQLKNQQYAGAKSTFGLLLKKSNASNVILNAAKADLGLGLTDSALRLSLQVLRTDPTSSEGYEVRGQTMALMGDFDSASQLFKEGLRLNPDCQRIKTMLKTHRIVYSNIKDARSAFFQRRFHDAVKSFTTAFDVQTNQSVLPLKAPLYSQLFTERAEAHLRLKEYESALQDASKAVYSLDDCVEAWIILSNALHGLGRHQDALSQLEDLMSKWGSTNDQIRRAYEKADFEVRKEKRPDFYALFGVSSLASEMELKKAYKAKAKELHPDRLSGPNYTDSQRKEAEKKFKSLGEGLEILCDDFKRQLYDEGYDQAAIRERVAAAQQAAHRQGGGRNYHNH